MDVGFQVRKPIEIVGGDLVVKDVSIGSPETDFGLQGVLERLDDLAPASGVIERNVDELPEVAVVHEDKQVELVAGVFLWVFIECLVGHHGHNVEDPQDLRVDIVLVLKIQIHADVAICFLNPLVDLACRIAVDEEKADRESRGTGWNPECVEFPAPRQSVRPAKRGPAAQRPGSHLGKPQIAGAKRAGRRRDIGPVAWWPVTAEPGPGPPIRVPQDARQTVNG
jgi:hypothetical protein